MSFNKLLKLILNVYAICLDASALFMYHLKSKF